MTIESESIPTNLRITDQVHIRNIVEEQRENGDATPTKTLNRILERYFAVKKSSSANTTQPQTPNPAAA